MEGHVLASVFSSASVGRTASIETVISISEVTIQSIADRCRSQREKLLSESSHSFLRQNLVYASPND